MSNQQIKSSAALQNVLSFEEACQRAGDFDRGETDLLMPTGHTRLLTQGRKTERVAVLFHGITNNPLQWEAFGRALHADGWNVLIPRLPYHGYRDRLTSMPGRLTSVKMIDYVQDSVLVATGLGERIAVLGLSAGGVYAAYAAQECGVERAVVIAPLFGLPKIPLWLSICVATVFRWLPNQMRWWDSKQKMAHVPLHAYPRYSTKNLAETLTLGDWVRRRAQRTPPLCKNISIVTNAADHSISNEVATMVADEWKRQSINVDGCLFDAAYNLPHDVIDITQPKGKPDMVYAKLRDFLASS